MRWNGGVDGLGRFNRGKLARDVLATLPGTVPFGQGGGATNAKDRQGQYRLFEFDIGKVRRFSLKSALRSCQGSGRNDDARIVADSRRDGDTNKQCARGVCEHSTTAKRQDVRSNQNKN